MGAVRIAVTATDLRFDDVMNDFWAIFTTIAVFAVLFLLVKGVERIER